MDLADVEYRCLARNRLWQSLTGRHRLRPARLPLTPEALARLEGRYAGETCFLIGTAPSLRALDLSRLIGRRSFAVNKGYDLSAHGLPRVTAYAIADQLAMDDYGAAIDPSRMEHLFLRAGLERVPEAVRAGAVVYQALRKPRVHKGFLQADVPAGIYTGHTVMLDAIQLAAWMGFARLALIGVDLDFQPADLHFYASSQREVDHSLAHSRRHTGRMARGMAVARARLAARGVELVNAGRADRLSMLPHIPFERLV